MREDRVSDHPEIDEETRISRREQEFVSIEKNIASFGFFTPTSKRVKNTPPKIIKFTRVIDNQRVEAKVTISGNTLYGMPSTADLDKYLAFQKILEAIKKEKGTITNPITFSTSTMLKMLGKTDAGLNYREVDEWLDVMVSTHIKSEGAVWLEGKKKWVSDSFVIFQRARRTGQVLEDGTTAEKNFVWLSDWYLENLNHHYILPVDFDTYKKLKNNISKSLIPLLQIWLYATRETGVFEKKYADICEVLQIARYKYPSDIKRFFGRSLDELVDFGFLESWKLKKTADKKEYKIIFNHGWKFYKDRAKRLAKADQNFTGENQKLIDQLVNNFQISPQKARELTDQHPAETRQQLAAFPFRVIKTKSSSGFLIKAIEDSYALPESYVSYLKNKQQAALREQEDMKASHCYFCDEIGYRNIKSDMDPMFGLNHKCTHDADFEKDYEEHKI